MSISEARLAANRANARRSTGPKTAAGKQAARLNAVKHGLTARTPVLADEDAGAFAELLADLEARFRPEGGLEREQMRAMAEQLWRMRRGPSLEALTLQALIDKEEAGELGPDEVISAPLLLLRIARYESHIQRAYERAHASLRQLQAARAAQPSPLPDRAGRRQEKEIGHGGAETRPSMPGERAQVPNRIEPRRGGQRNFPQFPAGDGFVSSFCGRPEGWPLRARLRASCADDALFGPPPPEHWRFASALRGATLAPAREALARAA